MNPNTSAIRSRVILQMIILVILMPLIPILISADWDWWEAWVYAGIFILGFIASRLLAARRHPDLLAERARSMQMEGAKSWDRRIVPWLAIGGVIALIVVGLDHRYGWSPAFPLWLKLTAFLGMILSMLLGSWALIENRFFSGIVRIQTERGHRVVSSGPYRYLRHPGYAGSLWVYLLTPILLDSIWAWIPDLLLIGLLIVRTALEDKTLQAELPGYAEYAQHTKYRLMPGVW